MRPSAGSQVPPTSSQAPRVLILGQSSADVPSIQDFIRGAFTDACPEAIISDYTLSNNDLMHPDKSKDGADNNAKKYFLYKDNDDLSSIDLVVIASDWAGERVAVTGRFGRCADTLKILAERLHAISASGKKTPRVVFVGTRERQADMYPDTLEKRVDRPIVFHKSATQYQKERLKELLVPRASEVGEQEAVPQRSHAAIMMKGRLGRKQYAAMDEYAQEINNLTPTLSPDALKQMYENNAPTLSPDALKQMYENNAPKLTKPYSSKFSNATEGIEFCRRLATRAAAEDSGRWYKNNASMKTIIDILCSDDEALKDHMLNVLGNYKRGGRESKPIGDNSSLGNFIDSTNLAKHISTSLRKNVGTSLLNDIKTALGLARPRSPSVEGDHSHSLLTTVNIGLDEARAHQRSPSSSGSATSAAADGDPSDEAPLVDKQRVDVKRCGRHYHKHKEDSALDKHNRRDFVCAYLAAELYKLKMKTQSIKPSPASSWFYNPANSQTKQKCDAFVAGLSDLSDNRKQLALYECIRTLMSRTKFEPWSRNRKKLKLEKKAFPEANEYARSKTDDQVTEEVNRIVFEDTSRSNPVTERDFYHYKAIAGEHNLYIPASVGESQQNDSCSSESAEDESKQHNDSDSPSRRLVSLAVPMPVAKAVANNIKHYIDKAKERGHGISFDVDIDGCFINGKFDLNSLGRDRRFAGSPFAVSSEQLINQDVLAMLKEAKAYADSQEVAFRLNICSTALIYTPWERDTKDTPEGVLNEVRDGTKAIIQSLLEVTGQEYICQATAYGNYRVYSIDNDKVQCETIAKENISKLADAFGLEQGFSFVREGGALEKPAALRFARCLDIAAEHLQSQPENSKSHAVLVKELLNNPKRFISQLSAVNFKVEGIRNVLVDNTHHELESLRQARNTPGIKGIHVNGTVVLPPLVVHKKNMLSRAEDSNENADMCAVADDVDWSKMPSFSGSADSKNPEYVQYIKKLYNDHYERSHDKRFDINQLKIDYGSQEAAFDTGLVCIFTNANQFFPQGNTSCNPLAVAQVLKKSITHQQPNAAAAPPPRVRRGVRFSDELVDESAGVSARACRTVGVAQGGAGAADRRTASINTIKPGQ